MKKNIIISVIIFFLFSQNIFSQAYYEEPSFQFGNTTYLSIKDGIHLEVKNVNNVLNTQFSNFDKEPVHCIEFSLDFWSKVKNILSSTLTLSKIQTFKGHRSNLISLRCWIDRQGKIIELRFLLARNTKITPSELATIEQRFKSEITFDIDCPTNANLNFIDFVVPINFKRIFNL